jgi:hypothetical protein
VSWKREGDVVTLTLTKKQFDQVLLALRIATGQAEGSPEAHTWFRLSNAVNKGNPNWKPYEVASTEDDIPW